jgi:hypothetical protein
LIPSGDEEAMKCFVAKYGPLSVGITVGSTSLESGDNNAMAIKKSEEAVPGDMSRYDGGVWSDPEGNCTDRETDHEGNL